MLQALSPSPQAAGALASDEGHGKVWGKGVRKRGRAGWGHGWGEGRKQWPGTGYGVAEEWGSVCKVLQQVEWDSDHSSRGQGKDVGSGEASLPCVQTGLPKGVVV